MRRCLSTSWKELHIGVCWPTSIPDDKNDNKNKKNGKNGKNEKDDQNDKEVFIPSE